MADTSQRRRFLLCPRCGAENLPNSRFCSNCGANLREGEQQAAMATATAPKGGTMLPYSPGMSGPGPTARLALVGIAFLLIACLALACVFLYSGADRTRPTPTRLPATRPPAAVIVVA
jgi:uncharacterized membrane protein YvbJ